MEDGDTGGSHVVTISNPNRIEPPNGVSADDLASPQVGPRASEGNTSVGFTPSLSEVVSAPSGPRAAAAPSTPVIPSASDSGPAPKPATATASTSTVVSASAPNAGSSPGVPSGGPLFGPVVGDVIDVNKLLGDGLTGWQTFEHGGADPGRGTTTLEAGDLVLREGNSLLVGATRRITLSANPGTVQLAYTSVTFDTTAKGQVRDAFELALVDDKGQSSVPTFTAPDRDAYYNQTKGLTTAFPVATVEEVNKVVRLDVSKLSPGSTATLVVRVVNPDSDTGSVVRIPGRHEIPTVTLTGATPISEGTKYTLGLAAGNLYQDTVTKWTID